MAKKDSVSDGTASVHQAKPVAAAAGADHEDIARLAYTYWEARSCDGGSPEEDWFRAENDLKARRATIAK